MAAKGIDLYDRQRRLAWYLIVPAVLVVLLVIGFPLGQVVVYSFMKYKLDGVTPASFVGLENYAFVLVRPRLVARGLEYAGIHLLLRDAGNHSWSRGRAGRECAFQGQNPVPHCSSRSLGHPNGGFVADLEMDVQRRVRRCESPADELPHHPGEDCLARDSRRRPCR